MSAFLRNIESKNLSGEQLVRMTKGKARWMLYNDLRGLRRLESIFYKTDCVFILLQIVGARNPVGHWIAMIKHPDRIEHFDSYGLSVDEELAHTYEDKYLSKLVQASKTNVVSSQRQLQAVRTHVNTCGRWCVFRCLMKELGVRDFYSFVDLLHGNPDMAAAMTTMFL